MRRRKNRVKAKAAGLGLLVQAILFVHLSDAGASEFHNENTF